MMDITSLESNSTEPFDNYSLLFNPFNSTLASLFVKLNVYYELNPLQAVEPRRGHCPQQPLIESTMTTTDVPAPDTEAGTLGSQESKVAAGVEHAPEPDPNIVD
jgi:hypothetical protein